jgi:P2-related tail formation protein
MKRLFKFLMIALVLTSSLFMTTQTAHASGDVEIIVQDFTTMQTYDGSILMEVVSNSGSMEVVDVLNNYSTLFTTTYLIIEYQSDTGKFELQYEDGGNFITYPIDIFSFIAGGSSVTVTGEGLSKTSDAFKFSINKREGISGQENFVTNVDDAKPLSYFMNYISAWDNVDGDLTSSIYVITDNYTANMSVLGSHTVTLGVTDSSSNESTFQFTVNVVDITNPVITGNSTKVQVSYTQTFNISSFKSTLVASDNYDTLSNTDIVVKTDGYTANKTNLGTYSIVFEVTDSSGNKATFTKQVEVIDDIAPMFSGPTSITKPTESILTVNDIKGDITASDVKDGNRTSYITVKEDNYTGYGDRVGSYTIIFEVADTKGNIATHTVTVSVTDDIPPVWYIKDGASIVLSAGMSLNRTQIISLLEATGQIAVSSTSQITFFQDEYSGNEETAGVYMMGFNFEDASGNESTHNFAITVLEDENTDPITVEPTESFGDLVLGFILTPFGAIITLVFVTILIVFIKSKMKPKGKKRRKNRK